MAHLLKQRYLVIGELGRGGMGAVYKAQDTHFGNRWIAIKEMHQQGLHPQEVVRAAEAFKREAMILAGLMHPNLPRIYDHFAESGQWYLVMDFIEGKTLDAYQERCGGRLSVEEVLDIAIQLCAVLDYLHTRQPPIIFRDLKPSNIMLTSQRHLYLIDFGIARHFKPGQQQDTMIAYSQGYAAPEQYGEAQTTPQSDIYSLGASLHHFLSGDHPAYTPFRFAPLSSKGGIFTRLNALILQMVELDENKRPRTMMAIKQELQHILEEAEKQSKLKTHWLAEGDAHYQAKRYQEAISFYDRVIELDPNDAQAYLQKALALWAGTVGRNVAWYLTRTILQLTRSRFQEALTMFDHALQLDALLIGQRDARLSRDDLGWAYFGKAECLLGLRRYEESLDAINRCLHFYPRPYVFPPPLRAYHTKTYLLDSLKRYQEALDACNHAIRIYPDDIYLHELRTAVLKHLGRVQEAQQERERVQQLRSQTRNQES